MIWYTAPLLVIDATEQVIPHEGDEDEIITTDRYCGPSSEGSPYLPPAIVCHAHDEAEGAVLVGSPTPITASGWVQLSLAEAQAAFVAVMGRVATPQEVF